MSSDEQSAKSGERLALLQRQSGKLVTSLRPLLTETLKRADVFAGTELLLSLDIPRTAGQIVVGDESDYSWLGRTVRFTQDFLVLILAIPIVCLTAAVVLSTDRRRGVIAVGLAVAIGAAVLFLALWPAEELLVLILDPENDTAARVTIDVLMVQDLRAQSFITILGGLAVMTGAWVAGNSEFSVMRCKTRRSAPRRQAPASPRPGDVSQEPHGGLDA